MKTASEMKTRKAALKLIYKAISEHTGHLFRDDAWQNVMRTFELIEGQGAEVLVNGTAYRENDGASWKEYRISVECAGFTFEGTLNANGAGSMDDPFSKYDISVVLW